MRETAIARNLELSKFEMRGWPHMDSLVRHAAASHGMPRFDDGTVDVQEPIRVMAGSLANEAMDARAEGAR